MAHLTIVANITAEPAHIDALKASLLSIQAPTRAEDGCVQYDLHQDNENPAHFQFFELWETREKWLAHMESDHLAAHVARTEGMVADFTIFEMTQIG